MLAGNNSYSFISMQNLAPIIVNAESDEFYKQPMYYVLGHFRYYVFCSIIFTIRLDVNYYLTY